MLVLALLKKMLERYSHIGNTAKRQAISVFDSTEIKAPRDKREKKAEPEGVLTFILTLKMGTTST
jgi:hypothetical protein